MTIISRIKMYKDWGEKKLIIDKVEPTHHVRNFYVLHKIKQIAKKYKIKSVCEIGCGIGIISNRLGKLGFKAFASDLNKEAIKISNKYHAHKNVNFTPTNILTLKKQEKYDLLLSIEVLEHIKKDEAALKKMNSLIRDNLL